MATLPAGHSNVFGLELDRHSKANGWGIIADLSYPGVAPNSLLDVRPEIGRTLAVLSRRLITFLSHVDIMGTVATAGLPALMAATTPGNKEGSSSDPTAYAASVGDPPSRSSPRAFAAATTQGECGSRPRTSQRSRSQPADRTSRP